MAVKRRVQKTPNDQYIVTIPKAIAELLGYNQGTEVEFELKGGELVLKRSK